MGLNGRLMGPGPTLMFDLFNISFYLFLTHGLVYFQIYKFYLKTKTRLEFDFPIKSAQRVAESFEKCFSLVIVMFRIENSKLLLDVLHNYFP